MTRTMTSLVLAVSIVFMAACTNMNKTQQGALSGGVLGAGAGLGLSALTGGSLGAGAAIGGVLGGVVGGIYGHDQQKR